MTEPLLTISAFARAVDLAPSALRYYDEAGLLPPTEVDAQTGYRYYTPDLERRAHMVRRMREVGVPVETMRVVLDGPADEAADILQGFATRASDTARRTAAAVADVVSSLHAESVEPSPVIVTVDGPELATALRRVSTAADDDPESPLGVVLLDFAEAELTVVATNRYWLATWSMPTGDAWSSSRRTVVPAAEVSDFALWLTRQRTVTLTAREKETRATGDQDNYPVPTTADRFPAYRLLLDAQPVPSGRVTVDRDPLLRMVAGVDDGAVLLLSGDGRVTVRPQGSSEGVRLPATTLGEPINMGFSPLLLASALTAVVGSEVTLSYTASDCAVSATSAEQRSFTALVMPVKGAT
ncbi:MAG: MerR family transcriptional regulator [Nocardioidaceae bacterium]